MASENQVLNEYQNPDLPKGDIPCLLCESCSHSTHRCYLTKSIRDRKIQVPLNLCQIHCGRLYALCKNGDCGLIKTKKGQSIDLTCKHKTTHFLLCDKQPCHTISEKYWKIHDIKKKTET